MKFNNEKGLHFFGNLCLVLSSGEILQGTFLEVAEIRKDQEPYFAPPLKVDSANNDEDEDDEEFIVLRLICAFKIFPVESIIAVNVAQILAIGPSPSGCAPG